MWYFPRLITYTQRYVFLTELRRDSGVVYCKLCTSDVARVEGGLSLHDLDKATHVDLLDTIIGVLPPFKLIF
jgi:hypothetical protein